MRSIALVLEDDLADQALARTLLEEAGWEVYTATSAALSLGLIRSWLGSGRDLRHTRVLILFDLIMDLHGLHLAAIVRDEQRAGRLQPAALVALTACYTAENVNFAQLAGCDAIYRKPLTASRVAQLAQVEMQQEQAAGNEESEWLRRWLIEEGRRLLSSKTADLRFRSYDWSAEDVAMVLKLLSGKGHQPADTNAARLIARFGGFEEARARLSAMVPALDSPLDSMLSELLSGASIVEGGRRHGYGRSQSYVIFQRLSERIAQFMAHHGNGRTSPADEELLDWAAR